MGDQRPVNRAGVQATQIEGGLRADILGGRLAPGQRIETRLVIERRFQASPVTVQRALDALIAEGFVVSRGRQGTFVADRPPHRHHWAIAFPLTPRSNGWNRYFAILLREAQRTVLEGETIQPVFLDREHASERQREHDRLAGDLRDGRFAGCICPVNPASLLAEGSAIPGLGRPLVVLGGAAHAGIPSVVFGGGWLDRALGLLRIACRKRMAYVGNLQIARQLARNPDLAVRHGLVLNPHWSVGFNPDALAAPLARDIVRLLLDRPGRERPDGLLIGDDNLVEPALQGISDLGLSTPGDLTVVAHANHPAPDRLAMPCLRLGYDLRLMLRRALDLLIAQRDGGPVRNALIEPATEAELR